MFLSYAKKTEKNLEDVLNSEVVASRDREKITDEVLNHIVTHVRLERATDDGDRTHGASISKQTFLFVPTDHDIPDKFRDEITEYYEKFSWRMNIEALNLLDLKANSGSLKHVVIIPSIPDKNRLWEADLAFKFLSKFASQYSETAISFLFPDELGETKSGNSLPRYIDYNNLEEITKRLYSINKILKCKYNYKEEDIIVDITSGTAFCSAAGMAYASLLKGRRIQYVDTNDHFIQRCDTTHFANYIEESKE